MVILCSEIFYLNIMKIKMYIRRLKRIYKNLRHFLYVDFCVERNLTSYYDKGKVYLGALEYDVFIEEIPDYYKGHLYQVIFRETAFKSKIIFTQDGTKDSWRVSIEKFDKRVDENHFSRIESAHEFINRLEL
jgi:hypothetical protein